MTLAGRIRINERNTLSFVSKIGAVLYVVSSLIAGAVYLSTKNLDILTGALLGGGLSLINFELLKRIGQKVFEDPTRLKLHWFVFIWIKFVALIAICFFVVYYKLVNIPTFYASLSIIVFAIIGATIYAVLQGFSDVVDDEMRKTEEKYIGWDDLDNGRKKDYKPGAKKSVFDKL
jgi:hypothetical protein